MYESEDEVAQRERVLLKVKRVLDEFSLHEGLAFMSEAEAATKRLQLRTFGSFRLGVHSPEADIDTCVSHKCPCTAVRESGGLVTETRLCSLCSLEKALYRTEALLARQFLSESADSARSDCGRD